GVPARFLQDVADLVGLGLFDDGPLGRVRRRLLARRALSLPLLLPALRLSLLCSLPGTRHLVRDSRSARFLVGSVAPAPAAILAQLDAFRIIPAILVRLVVPPLALF